MKKITFILLSGALFLSSSIGASAKPETRPHKLGDTVNTVCPVSGFERYTYCIPSKGTAFLGACTQEKPGTTYTDGYCCSMNYSDDDGSSETDIYVLYGPIPSNPGLDNNQLYHASGDPANPVFCPKMSKEFKK